jgi:hypothetical protein
MDFLENTLEIEDTKSIQIEKAYRFGRRKNGPTKPRPNVLKHNTSYSFTILRKPESDNFRTKPFEIFHVHILITLFPLDSFSVEFSSHSAASFHTDRKSVQTWQA